MYCYYVSNLYLGSNPGKSILVDLCFPQYICLQYWPKVSFNHLYLIRCNNYKVAAGTIISQAIRISASLFMCFTQTVKLFTNINIKQLQGSEHLTLKKYRIFIVIYNISFSCKFLSQSIKQNTIMHYSLTHNAVFYTTNDCLHVHKKWGTNGSGYEHYCLLVCDGMYSNR
jgi:hypothetical protein